MNFRKNICMFIMLLIINVHLMAQIPDYLFGSSQIQLYSSQDIQLINHVKSSIRKANSKLNSAILDIEGMSGNKFRTFLNNICSFPHTKYLEIGCWKGSTFISALYGNELNIEYAVGIDNWSEFNGPLQDFNLNCNSFLSSFNHYQVIFEDSFSLSCKSKIKQKITTYFYDGDHSVIAQEEAFTFYNDMFEDVFIAIVDDWNWAQVREGTFNAFNALNYDVLFETFIPDTGNNRLGWWNGVYIAVIRK